MEYMWTTVGNTIYYPDHVENPEKSWHQATIEHELVHVAQYKKYSVPLFLFLYLFFPMPIFFSYFRWKFEREAYLVSAQFLRAYGDPDYQIVDTLVNSLWNFYAWPWPKSWMRKWFNKELSKLPRK
jgi:hypothetical protein